MDIKKLNEQLTNILNENDDLSKQVRSLRKDMENLIEEIDNVIEEIQDMTDYHACKQAIFAIEEASGIMFNLLSDQFIKE